MRRHGKWALVAVALFALAAWLMMRGEGEPLTGPTRTVELPRAFTPVEWRRMERRQTLPASEPLAGSPAPTRPRDPLLAALAVPAGKSAVIFEANAIRNSPLGELLLRCLMNVPGENPLNQVKEQFGVDLLQDLDRVAVTEKGVVLSGNFQNAKWASVFGQQTPTPYGDHGSVLSPPAATSEGASPGPTFARWGDQLLYVGASPGAAQEAIDRVEGRTAAPPVLDESQTYGEIYGVLSSDDLSKLLPPDQGDLAARLRTVARKVQLHVDTSRDVGIVATVVGDNAGDVEDLGKTLGAALSLARLQAQATGAKDLSELLEFAKVEPRGGSFNLELALPLSLLEKQLAFCHPHGAAPGEAQPRPGPAAAP